MSVESDLGELVSQRIREVNQAVPESIGPMMDFQVTGWDAGSQELTMTCRTAPWMRNFAGTLHGGMCATILDQAMGFVAYCCKPREGTAPTVQMSVNYHRPLIPGKLALVKVRLVSVTRSFANLSCEAYNAAAPEKICLSGTGLYFFKEKNPTNS